MTALEAYELTLEKIDELKNDGIKVSFKNYPKDLINNEILNEYNDKEHISHQYWKDVTFKNVNEIEIEKISETLNYLSLCGISFDIYGCCGERTWQLDWSFRYTGKINDEWRDEKDRLESMLKNCDL